MHWWMALDGINFLFGLLLGSPVGVFLRMTPWLAPLEVLMGRLLFRISLLGISMINYVDLWVWLVGLLVLYYVVQELNPVRHKTLHLWRECLACWVVRGGDLLWLILVLHFFWECMPYGICIVLFLILCNRRLLHVVSMMIYRLAYCELLFLSLVVITLYSCNQIILIYVYSLIGGYELLIVW